MFSPTVAGQVVYRMIYPGTLQAIDLETGDMRWEATPPDGSYGMAVAGGLVYITSPFGQLLAYSVKGCGASVCDPVWSSAKGDHGLFLPTVANGVVYVGYYEGGWTQGGVVGYAADCSTGCQPLFDVPLMGGINAPPTVADGRVYASSANGRFFALGLP
jgi:outer membrane protein assembly factor BamB